MRDVNTSSSSSGDEEEEEGVHTAARATHRLTAGGASQGTDAQHSSSSRQLQLSRGTQMPSFTGRSSHEPTEQPQRPPLQAAPPDWPAASKAGRLKPGGSSSGSDSGELITTAVKHVRQHRFWQQRTSAATPQARMQQQVGKALSSVRNGAVGGTSHPQAPLRDGDAAVTSATAAPAPLDSRPTHHSTPQQPGRRTRAAEQANTPQPDDPSTGAWAVCSRSHSPTAGWDEASHPVPTHRPVGSRAQGRQALRRTAG